MAAKIAKIALIVVAIAVHGFLDVVGPWSFFTSPSIHGALGFVVYAPGIMLPSLCSIPSGALVYRFTRTWQSRLTAAAWGAGLSLVAPCVLLLAFMLTDDFPTPAITAAVTVIVGSPLVALRLAKRGAGEGG